MDNGSLLDLFMQLSSLLQTHPFRCRMGIVRRSPRLCRNSVCYLNSFRRDYYHITFAYINHVRTGTCSILVIGVSMVR